MLSDYSSDITEFKPDPSPELTTEMVSQGCQSDPIKTSDVGVAREYSSSAVQCNLSSDRADDEDLAKFLNEVFPLMDKELSKPLTRVFWNEDGDDKWQKESVHVKPMKQDLPVIEAPVGNNRRIISTWVSTSPILFAVSFPPQDTFYCDHATEQVLVVSTSILRITVRACISKLYCSDLAKNILIGGSVLGDIYIWRLSREAEGRYSYEELHHQPGDGMVTTINWCPSNGNKNGLLLISGQIDGRLNTWIYEKISGKVTAGQTFLTDKTTSSPITCLEPISESSFCVHRRGQPLTIYDINNFTTTKDKKMILNRGKILREIDPLLEITQMQFISDSNHSLHQHLIITGKRGDVFAAKIVQETGVIEPSFCIFRTPQISISNVIFVPQFQSLLGLTKTGSLELFEIDSGSRRSFPSFSNLKHFSVSGDFIQCCNKDYELQILSLVIV